MWNLNLAVSKFAPNSVLDSCCKWHVLSSAISITLEIVFRSSLKLGFPTKLKRIVHVHRKNSSTPSVLTNFTAVYEIKIVFNYPMTRFRLYSKTFGSFALVRTVFNDTNFKRIYREYNHDLPSLGWKFLNARVLSGSYDVLFAETWYRVPWKYCWQIFGPERNATTTDIYNTILAGYVFVEL